MKRGLLVVVAALAFPAAAAAHANLLRTVPANGAVLSRAPAAVRVVFDDTVRVGPGVAAVRNGGGSVLAGGARVVAARTLVVPLRPGLADGDYSVRWSIVSDDGHLESGVLAFAVGAGRAPPAPALAAEATGPTAASVLARWLLFAGLLVAAGAGVVALVLRPADEERLALLLSTGAVLVAAGAADEVHRVGLATRDGTALGAGFAAALLVASLAAAATLERRALRPAAVLALGLVAVPSFAGHALDPGLARVNVVADVVHVAAASVWVGALVGVVAFRDLPVRRLGALALGAVVVLAATGVVRASFELVHVDQLWRTGYGRALLVKTGLLLGAVAAGWLVRARARRRAALELVLVAGLVVAVAVLVQLRPGRNAVAVARATPPPSALEPSPPPPAPPPDAIVTARELGPYGVALESEAARLTAIVLSPAGGGADGLDVRIDGRAATPCGHGCYRVDERHPGSARVAVGGLAATFASPLPQHVSPGDAVLRGFVRFFRGSRSVEYVERLASDPVHSIVARWRLERPDRVTYAIPGGAQAVIVGGRRWDRDTPGGRWRESPQSPPLRQPAVPWTRATNVWLISVHDVVFVDPTIPAYFDLELHERPTRLRMIAAAHFMTDRYLGFNSAPRIRPPH